MSYRCCVEGCVNTNERFPSKGLFYDGKFTRFPENTEKRKLWNKIIGLNKNVKKFICSEHFTDDDWRTQDIMLNVPLAKRKLKPDAIPSRKLPITTSEANPTEEAAVKGEMEEQTRKRLVAEALAQYEIPQIGVNYNNSSKPKPLTRRRMVYRSLKACMLQVPEVKEEMDEQPRKRLVAEALAAYDKPRPNLDGNNIDSSDDIPTPRKKRCPTFKMQKCIEDEASIDEMEIPVKEYNFFPTQTRKCGEITLDVDDQTFVLNCSLCPGIFLDLLNFSNHVKTQHSSLLEKLIKNQLDVGESKKSCEELNDLTDYYNKSTDEMIEETIFSDPLSSSNDLQHCFLSGSENKERVTPSIESLPKTQNENNDIKLDNQAFIMQFIFLLKQNPIIWDKTHPLHMVYRIRRTAITELISPLSKTFPELPLTYNNTSSLLTRLRQMYTKELKQMQECNQKNEPYITRLWCFDKLKFLGADFENSNRLKVQINIDNIQNIAKQPPLDLFKFNTTETELITIGIIEEYKKQPILWNINHQQYRGKLRDYESLHQLQLILYKKYPKILLIQQTKFVKILKQMHQWYTTVETLHLHSQKFNQNFEGDFPRIYAALDFLRGNVAPFQCKFCKNEFSIEYKYVRHIRQKKYNSGACNKVTIDECQYCSKRFSTSAKLSRHLRMHTNERPYVCEKCGKTFRSYTTWFGHRRSHDKIKPFKCEECGRAYYTASMLRTHKKGHLGIRDKICDICGKTFTSAKALHRHRSEGHQGKPKYECNKCGKKLKQYKNILRHWKRCSIDSDSEQNSQPSNQTQTIFKM